MWGNNLSERVFVKQIKRSQRECRPTITPYFLAKYLIYGLSGGFYHSKEFKSYVKYSWILINIVSLITIIVMGCFGYWISTTNKTFADKAFVFTIAITNFFAIVVMPAMTYYFREELEMILHFVEKEWPTQALELEIRNRAQKAVTCAFAIGSCIATTYISMHPALMLFYGSSKLHSLQYYLYPVPWISQIDSWVIYFFISALHCMCAVSTISVLVAQPPLLMIIAFEFYFAFTITGNLLEECSTELESNLEENLGEHAHRSQIQAVVLQAGKIAEHQSKLMQKVTTAARDHQEILKKIKLIKPFIEILFSLFLPLYVTASFFITYVLCISQKLTLLQKIKTLGILGGGTIMMFSFTHAGKLFADMEESFSDVVYGFPWYYLSPQQRKVYSIFLNQTKHPVRFNALTMYSMVPMTSLNCLKLIYSFGNLLRNQINRRQVK